MQISAQGYSALFKLPSCALPYDPIVLLAESLRVSFCYSNSAVSVLTINYRVRQTMVLYLGYNEISY